MIPNPESEPRKPTLLLPITLFFLSVIGYTAAETLPTQSIIWNGLCGGVPATLAGISLVNYFSYRKKS